MQNSVLTHKTLLFAARIIKLRKHLNEKFKEFDLAKQIGKSGTSIGANVNEANYAQSKADFVSKMQIALKETAETEYWIRLLCLTGYITSAEEESLLTDCIEIKKLLVSTVNTAKQN
ncbi:MAG: four helix bundle protein [Clostridia bacterium]|nr:four helix bundle protein [Clostridia bacterium]